MYFLHQEFIVAGLFILQNRAVVFFVPYLKALILVFSTYCVSYVFSRSISYSPYRTNTKEGLLMGLPWLLCHYLRQSVQLLEEHCKSSILGLSYSFSYLKYTRKKVVLSCHIFMYYYSVANSITLHTKSLSLIFLLNWCK